MQVKLDDEILYKIDERMIKLIANEVINPIEHIKHLLMYFVKHKCDRCYERIEKEYLPILRNDAEITSLPKSKQELADLIFSHKDYKNRAEREIEIEKFRSMKSE